jgi:hypothetical protein
MSTSSLVRLFLAIAACYLDCLDRVALAHPLWALATFPVRYSVLSCWTNWAPSTPFSSTFLHSCTVTCLQAKLIALMTLRVWLSTFPLWALLLICGVTISSSQKSRYMCLQFTLFPIRIFQHPQYKCIYQATSIKVRSSFKGKHLVDLVQMYTLTRLSRRSTQFSVTLQCMMISG